MAISERRLRNIANALIGAGNCDFRIHILITEIRRQRKVVARQNRMIKYLINKHNDLLIDKTQKEVK